MTITTAITASTNQVPIEVGTPPTTAPGVVRGVFVRIAALTGFAFAMIAVLVTLAASLRIEDTRAEVPIPVLFAVSPITFLPCP
jgi:hypothetical protein